MTSSAPLAQSLLEEIDARQDELLAELDKLNSRIEAVLRDCSTWRGPEEEARPAAA